MRSTIAAWTLVLAAALAACGGGDEREEREERKEPMRVEDTVFAPVVTAPERAGKRASDSVDLHRQQLEKRLDEDEGAVEEEAPAGD